MYLYILAVINTSESYPWYTLTVIIHDIESGWATYKWGRCIYTPRKKNIFRSFHHEIIQNINKNSYGVATIGTKVKGYFISQQSKVFTLCKWKK